MRLLFIRLSSIGDIVFTTPAIRCAKQQIPGAEIHFLTKPSMKSVTEANPYIDHFHYHDNNLAATINSLKAAERDLDRVKKAQLTANLDDIIGVGEDIGPIRCWIFQAPEGIDAGEMRDLVMKAKKAKP